MRLVRLSFFGALALLLTCMNPLRAQPPIDPFGEEFRAPPRKQKLPAVLPAELPKAIPVVADADDPLAQQIADLVKMDAFVEPPKARRGQVVQVTIEGQTKPWSHTYSAVKQHATQSGLKSKIRFKDAAWFRPLGSLIETGALEVKDKGETQYELYGPFQWQQKIYIEPDAPLGRQTIVVQPFLQVCTRKNVNPDFAEACLPPSNAKALKVVLDIVDGEPLPPPADLQPRTKPSAIVAPAPDQIPTDAIESPEFKSLGALLATAAVGAFLMLLTPCVFPMIPITVNFFIKQSEKEHHRPFLMASVYAGAIVALLTAVIFFVGMSIIDLAGDAWVNLGIGMILILFALGLFGMFDVGLSMFFGTVFLVAMGYAISRLGKLLIPYFAAGNHEFMLAALSILAAVPVTLGLAHLLRYVEKLLGFEESAILGFFGRQESRGGMIGAAFMAMTFTVTSFSCTGPFLGILLAPLAGTNLPRWHLLAAALVYSTTFAAPFFVLALFPSYLKKLPRSGGWMTTIKVTMGFLEIGAALKFLSVVDLTWFPGNPRLFNFDTVLTSWIALSIACSLYLFGIFRLHHDTPEDHIGVPRMLFGSIFLGLAIYLTPLLFGSKPTGIIMEGAISFLPPDLARAHGQVPWIDHDYEAAWKKAVAEKKLIFIDFTGANCANCRENENNVFPRPTVTDLLKKYVCLKLYTDTVQDPKLTSDQAVEQGKLNRFRQYKLIRSVAQPSYVILDPSRDQPFLDKAIDASVIGYKTGRIDDPLSFERFLFDSQKGNSLALQPGPAIRDDAARAALK